MKQILASEEINKSKRAGLWESQSEMWEGKLTIWPRSRETEKLKQGSAGPSIQRGLVSQSLWWMSKYPKTNTSTDALIERT